MKTGVVDTVINVDTFTLKTGETIRLIHVDATDVGISNTNKGREELNRLIGGKPINCEIKGRDVYGHLVAEVWINSTNINDEMIRFMSGL
jgi:endonuclease YncB( thermonuclease family)